MSSNFEFDKNLKTQYSNKELLVFYDANKDKIIRNEIIVRYMYIVEILSKKYVNKGIDYEDIYQIASLALIKAVERFDINRGFEFTSFATPTIIGEIKKYFRDRGWAIRLPRRIQELSKKVNEAKLYLTQQLNRVPTVSEISEYIGCTEEQALEAMEAGQVYNLKSLNQTYEGVNGDKEVQLIDIVGSEDHNFFNIENMDFVNQVMEKLSEVEIKILRDRFYERKTQSEVAKELKVSQMTVSRIENKVVEKFKKELRKIELI